jgi:dihydroneopterin aldolase
MSDLISVKGIAGFGYHGVFDEERKTGQEFSVDVELLADLQHLGDDLNKTIDYSKIVLLAKQEIEINPVNLIETLAERIAEKILDGFNKVTAVTVTVHKPMAPIAAKFSDLSVTIHKAR